ncbi:hypothetical protein RGUI_4294 (plasmid) [Rhodovulum sp. P5]|nr:hypothetical protein RGUI_4294 [Rhodovulum sp. P5]
MLRHACLVLFWIKHAPKWLCTQVRNFRDFGRKTEPLGAGCQISNVLGWGSGVRK